MKYDKKQLDEMLKKHLLPQSKFEEIISKQDKPRDKYILWALENDSPRGVGITWEETQTRIIQYEKKLASEGYKYANDKEWLDHMQITAKKMEDSVSEHFIYTISDKKWDEIVGDDKKKLKAIIDKQCAEFKRQSLEAQAEMDRIDRELKIMALARTPLSKLILRKIRMMPIDGKRLELEKQRDYHQIQKNWCDDQINLMPPKYCPSIDSVEHLEGSLVFESNVLRQEWQQGLHMWMKNGAEFKPSWIDLLRWASHNYTIEGKEYSADSWYNSQKSSKSRTNSFTN